MNLGDHMRLDRLAALLIFALVLTLFWLGPVGTYRDLIAPGGSRLDQCHERVERRAVGGQRLGDRFGRGPAGAALRGDALRSVEGGRIKPGAAGKAGGGQAGACGEPIDSTRRAGSLLSEASRFGEALKICKPLPTRTKNASTHSQWLRRVMMP